MSTDSVEAVKNNPKTSKNNDSDSDSDIETLTHDELTQVTASTLAELLARDSMLSDLPHEVTLEEVNAQIALQYGQSMTVYIVRDDEELPIVVPQGSSTVLDLKCAFQRYLTLRLLRQKSSMKISWRHVWRTHWLCHGSQLLKKDERLLSSYGICNKSRVVFRKRLKEKGPMYKETDFI